MPIGPKAAPRINTLTDREKQVLALLGEGLSIKEVARELDLSPSTVCSHKRHMALKLGTTSRTIKMLNMARELGVFDTTTAAA